jgi:polyhydroxyalkanoate synthesis regulator phasin
MNEDQEIRRPSSDLVPPPAAPANEIDEVKQATKKLMGALQKLAKTQARSARDLSQDAYQEIEHSVQMAKTKADRQIRTVAKEVGTAENRVTKAAKAAWDMFKAPRPKD